MIEAFVGSIATARTNPPSGPAVVHTLGPASAGGEPTAARTARPAQSTRERLVVVIPPPRGRPWCDRWWETCRVGSVTWVRPRKQAIVVNIARDPGLLDRVSTVLADVLSKWRQHP